MKTLKNITLLSFLIIPALGWAQDKIPLNDYYDLIEKSQEYNEDGNNQKAYETLSQLNKNDSLYPYAINTLAYYLLNNKDMDDSRFDSVIKITDEGIKDNKLKSKFYLYINKAAALYNQKKLKEAMAVYDDAMKEYPRSYYLLYQKGLMYEELKEHDKAAEMYKQSIILNPYFEESHLKLGYLAYSSHKITQAIMCFNFYLMLNPDGKNSFRVLEALNTVVSAKPELEEELNVTLSKDDETFDELDLIINNHVSLSKKYKIPNKLNIAIVRQNHLMLDQLKNYEGNDGYFHQKYVKFYNWVRDNKQFNAFCYTTCFSIKNENYRKILDGKVNEIKEFIPIAYDKIGECFRENEFVLNGKKQTAYCVYSNYEFQGIGNMKNGKMIGYWETYNPKKGFLLSKGSLNEEEKKEGQWTWYYENGNIQEEGNFKNGKLDGIQKFYFDNGQLKYSVEYKDGKADGEYKLYNKNGALIEHKFFKEDKLDGIYKSFYDVGEKYTNYIIPYKNDKIDGKVEQYYANGVKSLEVTFAEGKKTGEEKEYYKNGKPYATTIYEDGVANGKFISYYTNGKTKTEGLLKEGEREGVWKFYHKNGKVETECTYVKGKINGEYKEYDVDGIHYLTYEYRKGDVYAFEFFDKTGKSIHADDKSSGKLDYKGYYPNGSRMSEGIYNLKGGKEGEWKYYNNNGLISSSSVYKENKLEGKTVVYHANGNVDTYKNFENDTLEGYYTLYYPEKNKYGEGWYKKGQQKGLWKSYYPNDRLKEVNYYQSGTLYGVQTEYSVADDKKVSELTYKSGVLISEDYFDDKGNVYLHTEIPTKALDTLYTNFSNKAIRGKFTYNYGLKNGPFTEYYPNGKVRVKGFYLNGQRHDKWVWYHENGKTESEYNYVCGDIEGIAKNYHENGELQEEKTYDLGVLVGTEKDYNDKGILLAEINYLNGKINGKRYFYSEDGNLQLIRHYLNGEIIGYSYNGKDKKEVAMIATPNETGKVISYFDNGKKAREMNIVKGNFEGEYIEYYYNGQVHQQQTYKEDELDGIVKTYYPSGKIKKEENYINGYKNGKDVEYYENGKIKSETDYVYDILHGKLKEYSSDGKITKDETYFNGSQMF